MSLSGVVKPPDSAQHLYYSDGLLITAAPDLLEMVLHAISCGEACGGSEGMARDLKARLAVLGLVTLGRNEYGEVDERLDLTDTDPV